MKKYILIDLDNTIIDFNECARHSIISIFEKFNLPYSENVFKTFIEENVKIWKRLEKGEITKDQLRANRWNIILGKLGIDFDGPTIEDLFEKGVAMGAYPVEGAYEMLDYLSGKYDLYIVSNGFRFVQESRLKIGDFNKYFKDVFVSEDVGVQKPGIEFFEYYYEKIGKPEKSEIILIGDNLQADILGGNNFGIDTVWFNKSCDELIAGVEPTHIIDRLSAIKGIL